MAHQAKAPAIGIDLGTTYSCVGVWLNNRVEIIANAEGKRTTPSCVAFTDKERLIGEAAKLNVISNPSNTISDAKRLIGGRFSDEAVQNDVKHWPFKVIADSNDRPKIVVEHKGSEMQLSPEEVSAMVLQKMREIAETYLGNSVRKAVVTVPAYFNNAQRQATKDACTIAGLEVMRIIHEPTAAAIAYGYQRDIGRNGAKNVFVFDLGGGTFDVTLLSINESDYTVKATGGNTHLGGEDINNRMVEYFVQEFKKKHNEDISNNQKALRRLRIQCEQTKCRLSAYVEAVIQIECLCGGIDFQHTVTRAWFEQLNSDIFEKCLETVDQCLKDAKMEKSSVHEIVLVGGSTRIPMIQELLQKYFHGKELCTSINPDEAVAYGAAIQAALLNGDYNKEKRLNLYDVTPLSLGFELESKIMEIVIPRNTTVPVKQQKTVYTVKDNQATVSFPVYQGERAKAADNHFLGNFKLKGIPLAPCGEVSMDVTFSIDVDGILTATAQETSTGVKSGIIIVNDHNRLSEKQIKKMVEDSERLKVEDEQHRKKAEGRNTLERYANKMRNAIKRIGDATEERNDIRRISNVIEETLKWLEKNNDAEVQEITDKMENLRILCKPIDGEV